MKSLSDRHGKQNAGLINMPRRELRHSRFKSFDDSNSFSSSHAKAMVNTT